MNRPCFEPPLHPEVFGGRRPIPDIWRIVSKIRIAPLDRGDFDESGDFIDEECSMARRKGCRNAARNYTSAVESQKVGFRTNPST